MKLFLLGVSLSVALIYLAWRAAEDIVVLPQEGIPTATVQGFYRLQGEYQPFQEAIRLAEMAVAHAKTARTQADWFAIAHTWQQAADLMSVVPREHKQYTLARDRVELYRRNSQYAQQRAQRAK